MKTLIFLEIGCLSKMIVLLNRYLIHDICLVLDLISSPSGKQSTCNAGDAGEASLALGL